MLGDSANGAELLARDESLTTERTENTETRGEGREKDG